MNQFQLSPIYKLQPNYKLINWKQINSTDQSPYCEDNSAETSQKISLYLCSPKAHYHMYKSPPFDLFPSGYATKAGINFSSP
jgi:hypothetical protein